MSDDAQTLPAEAPAVVIGAGPAGLAAAAELGRVGIPALVLDGAHEVGSSWGRHYDRLHLHTVRWLSSLPGYAIPRARGRCVARDDFRRYLADYTEHHGLDVRLGAAVTGVTREPDDSWSVESAGTRIRTPLVIVATGYNHTPRLPDWPGLDGYPGRVVHSSEYRSPAALGARSVLVVGPGNSGAEIAVDLAAAGIETRIAVRRPPNIVRRSVLGIPSQVLVLSVSPLPARIADRIARLLQRATVGDLGRFGLPYAPRGLVTAMERDDSTPTIDVGLIAAVRAGRVTVVPAVASFTGDSVVLADGSELRPDAVVAATGYRRGLDALFGDLDVIAPTGRPRINAAQELPDRRGLYFLGYSNPLTGNLRQLGIDARAIAERVRPR
jgi:putative flavoprotein involved in K+ transport